MNNILITGSPGVGKTTLVKKIIHRLKTSNVECGGFYTEEVRSYNSRIGFDIVTLNGERAILSRKNPPQDGIQRPLVGQYAVYVDDFEKLALPVFENLQKIVVIDEIGKMEMFSKNFQNNVREVFDNKTVQVIATIPVKGGPSLVKQLKERRDCQLITVNPSNRENLVDEIVKSLSLH
ncbi:cancer-related nucleoside-triphosphatase homolog isoform X2 [Leptinotarsa decemlineata]|uniref:cancer-related nucleoside-triphosphatase homolog isoform X2 n=1 Tax=Leptinotarsa decemlineata TaxID=7539 RepID=UPI000C255B82|nr:cancer-related nucleoside-triphosphatase homolog isoform X2 [Leptinotarsa decemlineata]